MMNTEAIWLFISTQGVDFGLKILAAIAAWVVGRWLISMALRVFSKALERGRASTRRWPPICAPF